MRSRLHTALLLLSLLFSLGTAHAAGLAFIEVPADARGPALRGAVWTPCSEPPAAVAVSERTTVLATPNCAVAGEGLPLVVFSHGFGGAALGHHDTAAALADAGFVVAAIEHPGDNWREPGRGGLSVFLSRPVDLQRLIDHMLATWPARQRLDPARIGVFGFSRGGSTALALAGAVPDFRLREDFCPPGRSNACCDAVMSRPWPALKDPRIRAAVAVDPLNLFDAQGLKAVAVPLQLWGSAEGGDGLRPEEVLALRSALPVPPQWHLAEGAGHFAFLPPCSAAQAAAMPALCRDKPGFDRAAFHARFNTQVLRFLQQHLPAATARGAGAQPR